MLPHWERSCRSNFLSHPVTAYWHRPTNPSVDPKRQAPGRVATGVPIFKSLVWLDPEKSRRKRESNPGSAALEADDLTTRPTRRSQCKEPLITTECPERLFHHVEVVASKVKGQPLFCLLTTTPEGLALFTHSPHSCSSVNKTKKSLALHVIVVPDNRPRFNSAEFPNFVEEWNLSEVFSILGYMVGQRSSLQCAWASWSKTQGKENVIYNVCAGFSYSLVSRTTANILLCGLTVL